LVVGSNPTGPTTNERSFQRRFGNRCRQEAVDRKAKPGEVVQLYATGLVVTPAGVIPTPQGVSGVMVTVGAQTVPADFAGLVAVGEFQINFRVPQLADGTYPVSISVNGVSSPATINSNPPAPIVLPVQH
jgi:uncharacterized protein (TIGR03437 family)